ncbi:MAG: HAD-IIIA family hydrolase [Lachnospiraceae bacterium]|nr:HAD-IIIA family hydrolase [Lachnospiraceae bacterium]
MSKDLKKIRLFAMDVDGTLTDGKIYIGDAGEVMKAFDPKDGLGIKLLMKHDIIPVIITGRTSQIVTNRCKEIGITEVYQGVKDKGTKMKELMKQYQLSKEETAYIGDDLNDLSAMRNAGITFAPADCTKQIKPYVDIILTRRAGESPVREAVDMILEDRLDVENFVDW